MADYNFPHKYLSREVGPRRAAEKKRNGICKHWGCNNPAMLKKRQCTTCKSRVAALNNPARYAFNQLKTSARKRHIPFELTFEEFQVFDSRTGYVAGKGRDAESLTCDRRDASKGYTLDNIRVLTWDANCKRLVEGLDDPVEPIAQALALVAKSDNWHAFKKQALAVLHRVEILQAHNEGGFELLPELDPEHCPF